MLKSVLIFFIGFLFGAGTIGITVSAETVTTDDVPYVAPKENFINKIIPKMLRPNQVKVGKKYIIKTPYGDLNVDSFEFNEQGTCIYTDKNTIICGTFIIALF